MFIFVVNLYILMKHLYNYIIQITNELNETFKTESGVEFYGHDFFNKDRLSNRDAVIVSKPAIFDDELLEEGTEILIDPSVYYHSTHGDDDKIQYTTNTIDREKGLYAIEPQNIVLYKENDTWKGYLDNFLGECIKKEKSDTIIGGIITEIGKKEKSNEYHVTYSNDNLKSEDVEIGDKVYIRPEYGVSVWLDGKEYTWLRNTDVLAKIE
jgi:co-chaperonin GroES (HSP10)